MISLRCHGGDPAQAADSAQRAPGGQRSTLSVGNLRLERPYDPGTQEILDLQRYLDYHRAGRYDHLPALAGPGPLAVTSLAIQTADMADHRELLETVRDFLGHTGGVLVSPREADRKSFEATFLAD